MTLKTVEWKNNSVIMIDQTKLPNSLEFVTYTDYEQVANAIKTLVVRGAPAIGVSGAFGLALAALQCDTKDKDELIIYLENAQKILLQTRPTAVNLAWGLEKIMNVKKNIETKTIESHLTRIRKKLLIVKSKIQISSKDDVFYLED